MSKQKRPQLSQIVPKIKHLYNYHFFLLAFSQVVLSINKQLLYYNYSILNKLLKTYHLLNRLKRKLDCLLNHQKEN